MRKGIQCLSGDETGLVKLISYNEDGVGKAEQTFGKQSRENGVERIHVSGPNNVAIGTVKGSVYKWDEFGLLDVVTRVGGGRIKGLYCSSDRLVTCGEDGLVETRLWPTGEIKGAFKTGFRIDFGRVNDTGTQVALGGKDNDIKIWNLETGATIFKGRNVPNDSLDMPVPIWITDAVWTGENSLLACTAFNQIRAYDLRQRRPIRDLSLKIKGDDANRHLNCIAKDAHNNAITADNFGLVSLVDVYGGQRLLTSFKGPKASVRSIDVDLDAGIMACGGLDRYVRMYDLESHKQIGRCYVKQRVTAVGLGFVKMANDDEENSSGEEIDWGNDDDDDSAFENEESTNSDDENADEINDSDDNGKRPNSKRHKH